jgi:hypothetical protein
MVNSLFDNRGMMVIMMGLIAIISAITPDKTFGLGLGIGLILIGICAMLSK